MIVLEVTFAVPLAGSGLYVMESLHLRSGPHETSRDLVETARRLAAAAEWKVESIREIESLGTAELESMISAACRISAAPSPAIDR